MYKRPSSVQELLSELIISITTLPDWMLPQGQCFSAWYKRGEGLKAYYFTQIINCGLKSSLALMIKSAAGTQPEYSIQGGTKLMQDIHIVHQMKSLVCRMEKLKSISKHQASSHTDKVQARYLWANHEMAVCPSSRCIFAICQSAMVKFFQRPWWGAIHILRNRG